MEAKSRGDFVLERIGLWSEVLWEILLRMSEARINPPAGVTDVLLELERDGLVVSVAAVAGL